MHARKCEYYQRKIRHSIDMQSFDNVKLKAKLPKRRGEQVEIDVWNRNLRGTAGQEELWATLKQHYEEYRYKAIRIRIYGEIHEASFLKLLEIIDGEETELLLETGGGEPAYLTWPKLYQITALTMFNCNAISDESFQKSAGSLSSASYLRMLCLEDATEDQMTEVLETSTELYCVSLSLFEAEDIEGGSMLVALKNLQKTVLFPAEIQIRDISEEQWKSPESFEDLRELCDSLNKRKESPEFWKMVVSDAIKKRKQTRFARSKMMFVGQGRAGKTSTINSLLGLPFKADQASTAVAETANQISITTTSVNLAEWKKKEFEINPVDDDLKDSILLFKNEGDNVLLSEHRANKLNDVKGTEDAQNTGQPKQQEKQKKKPKKKWKKNKPKRTGKNKVDRFGKKKVEQLDNFVTFGADVQQAIEGSKSKISVEGKVHITRTVTLWDFGGQEIFYTVHHLFLTRNGVYILVFDITKILDDSTKGAEVANLRFWVESVRLHAEGCPILFVATHAGDATYAHKETVNEILTLEVIQHFKDWKHFPNVDEKLNFFPIENSDKDPQAKQQQIERIQSAVQSSMDDTKHFTQMYSKSVPLAWVYFMDRAVKSKENNKRVSYKDLWGRAKQCSMTETDLSQALNLYHEYGTILSFHNQRAQDAKLGEVIILDPSWLVEALRGFLFDIDLHKPNLSKELPLGLKPEFYTYCKNGQISEDLFVELLKRVVDKKEMEYLLALFKYTLLLTDYNFGEQSKVKGFWFVPSMCKENVDPKEFQQLKALKKKIKLCLRTARPQPQGFFERVVCSYLRLSNAIENSLPPAVTKMTCCIYFVDFPMLIEKDPNNQKTIHFYFQRVSAINPFMANIIQQIRDGYETLESDVLGEKLGLDLLAYGNYEGESIACSMKDILLAKSLQDMIKPRDTLLSVPVNCFTPIPQLIGLWREAHDKEDPQLSQEYDVFIGHTWGAHGEEHEVAKDIATYLQADYRVFLDENDIKENIVLDVTKAIDKTKVFVALVTKQYMVRLNDHNTNASKEFNYADKRTPTILFAVLDKDLCNPSEWEGPLGYHAGSALFYNLSDNNREKGLKQLNKAVAHAIKERKKRSKRI